MVFDPERTHVPLCPFHAVTGLSCPLCGGLRSAYALLHGQLGAAVRDNVLLVAAVPLLLCWWVDWALRSRDGRPSRRPSRAVQMTVVVVALAFTVLRNLSFGAELRPV
ncbi:MAG: DUF2752 domain-containing protein [Actinobacteria bacterium]|nr:DUF2752 domain-containing protein [Actinomycetota bacterium]